MLIQFHLLQNYAPSNLNRDDTGSPKDAIFGGYRRGRISSQCLKRSIRRSAAFVEEFEREGLLAVRTKGLPGLIREELQALGLDQAAVQAIVARVPEIGRESAKRRAEDEGESEAEKADTEQAATEVEEATRQLIFLARNELRPLAERLVERYHELGARGWDKAKMPEITAALGQTVPRSVDVAMFGRMTTSAAFGDVQAAVQVAHALSTNALTPEFDYYTAVDDLSGESGAGMIGDVEFNSSTYYKYLNVHWEELVKNLGDDVAVARRAVLALLEAAATAQPTGKQNSFAAFSLPDLVLVEVGVPNLPVSYANAFLKPARVSGDQSLMDVSVRQLGDYLAKVSGTFNLDGKRAFIALSDYAVPGAKNMASLRALGDWLAQQLPE